MSNVKKPLAYLSVIALFVAVFAMAPAEANPKHKHHKHHHDHYGLKGLDLSEEQKVQVKDIIKNAKEQKKALHQPLKEYKKAMGELINSPDYSEQAVRSLYSQYQSVFADKAVLKANKYYQINQVLTPEQKAKKAEMKQKYLEKKRKKMKESS